MSTQRGPLRWLEEGEQPPSSSSYWRTHTHAQRLEAVLRLHVQGNALFKGGQRPFTYTMRFRDARAG